MIKKEKEKKLAIELRKQGLTYNEILKKIPIAKSTLSVWLKDIGVAKRQSQRLTLQRKLAQIKASETCREIRVAKEKDIIGFAKKEIRGISKRELWLIGTAIYWAEGSKQKSHNVSQGVSFGNSDPKMILLFKKWMNECCSVEDDRLYYRIYIHETADIAEAKKFWSGLIGKKIEKTYLKKHNPKTMRKNSGNDYHGLLRIDVTRSTDLNRKIKGWILGIADNV